jgi:4-amino-4-deoxy-L-arabinose transferase-like glycosyltransferase
MRGTRRVGFLAFTPARVELMHRARDTIWLGIAAAAIVSFVLLATFHVRLPGLYYDELFEVVPSLAFVKGGLASDVFEIPKSVVSLGGHPLELMAQPYNGGLKTILFAPFAAAFGISAASVRFFTVGIAAAALAFYYLFARRLFASDAIAALSVVLLACDPSYVFFSRVDYGPSVLMFLLKAMALWLLVRWWQSPTNWRLAFACFVCGLGVYDKTDFLWIVAAMAFAALILDPRGVRERISARAAGGGTAAFIAGALPLVLYNASWPPRTLAPLREGTIHLHSGSTSGNFGAQLEERVRELTRLLDGQTASSYFGGHPYAVVPVLPSLTLAAAALFVTLYVRRGTRGSARPAMYVLLSGIAVLVAAALTHGGDKPHHLLLVYPFPHVLVAAAAVTMWKALRTLPPMVVAATTAALTAAVLTPPAIGLAQTRHVLEELQVTGGSGTFSDGIYNLARYLSKADAGRHVVILDWGIFYNVVALTDGRVPTEQLWLQLHTPQQPPRALVDKLVDPRALYVVHSPGATQFPWPRRHFISITASAHLRRLRVETIYTRNRVPLFFVYRLVAARAKTASLP